MRRTTNLNFSRVPGTSEQTAAGISEEGMSLILLILLASDMFVDELGDIFSFRRINFTARGLDVTEKSGFVNNPTVNLSVTLQHQLPN